MKFDYDRTYFDPKETLECGQVFRFFPFENGYLVLSKDKACRIYADEKKTYVECGDGDGEYFYNYFDLSRDYKTIVDEAKSFNIPFLSHAAEVGKGIRLLNQNEEETVISFVVSQNNNIPRIKGILSRICEGLGERKEFLGKTFYTFPSSARIAEKEREYYRALGAGYRDIFIKETAARLARDGVENLKKLDGDDLKKELLTFKGIGEKVADCIRLFGFKKCDSFPVDTWVERIYKEDFGGTLTDRKKIGKYFVSLFGEYSGYVQQYLFFAKRENL